MNFSWDCPDPVTEGNLRFGEKPTNEKLETDGINEWHKENIEKMANIYLEASDQYVRYVSSHIDKDPDDFFEELKVRNDIIFQANYHKEEHGYPEYVITVLNAWITKQEQLVSLFTLYSALNIRHYDNLCSGLANLLR